MSELTPPSPLRKWHRAFIGLWCAGAAYASFAQLALQQAGARASNWGFAPGWQREIGFWNIGLIAVLVPILRRGNTDMQLAAIRALVLVSALFGTNHAVEAFRGGHLHLEWISHIGGAAENYVAVVLGVALLVVTARRKS